MPSDKSPNDFYRYSGMAIKMAIVILIGVYAGRYIDASTASKTPIFTILLSLLGVAAAIYIVVKDTAA